MSIAPTRAHVASPTSPAPADPEIIPTTEYLSNDAINRRAGLNKRELRKQKKTIPQSLPTPPDTSSETDVPAAKQKPPNNPSKRKHHLPPSEASTPTPSIPQALTPEMPPGNPIPLLVCSIGNPGATYANTLHSADRKS